MRVGYVAASAEAHDGWGRYTVGLVRAVRARGIEPVLVTGPSRPDPSLEGVEHHPILAAPLERPYGTLRGLAAVRRLRSILAGCDVVHNIVELFSPLVALSCGRSPLVQTFHGTWAVLPLRSAPRRWLFAAALRRTDLLVFQSRYTRDAVASLTTLPRHEIWPAGVESTRFEAVAPSALPSWADDGIVVLSVGILKPRKGHHVALRAAAEARRVHPHLRLVLIGAQPEPGYAAALCDDAARLGFADRLHLMGTVGQDELAAWYHRADVFLLLPVNQGGSFEGLGLAYLEAGVCGKSSIATTECGAQEAVLHEDTGLLVPQKNAGAAAAALIRLLGDAALRRRMGEAARRRARAMSWGALAERLVSAYSELQHGRSPAPAARRGPEL